MVTGSTRQYNLYMVRHAHATWQTSEQRGLSKQGLLAAQRVADVLDSYPIDIIYSSPYTRAIQTIQPLAERLHLPVKIDQRLVERKICDQPIEDFMSSIRWLWNHPVCAYPGGESNHAAADRGLSFIKLAIEQASLCSAKSPGVVVSTHGNLITLILQIFFPQLGYDFWMRMTFPDIYQLQVAIKADEPVILHVATPLDYPKRLWSV
jgi:broad specificity phosphatase PhoE